MLLWQMTQEVKLSASGNLAFCQATQFNPFFGFQVQIPAEFLEESLKHPDAIQTAVSLGRLDFISTALTVLGIMLGLFSLVGFWMLRSSAIEAARTISAETTPKLVKDLLTPDFLSNAVADALKAQPELIFEAIKFNPALLRDLMERAKALTPELLDGLDSEQSDDIATKIDG